MKLASFRKRGKTWQYIIELGRDPVTGKRKQLTKGGFRTKKLAEDAARKIEQEIADGTFIEESDITFNDFVPIWLEYYSKYVKQSTINTRMIAINTLNKYIKSAKLRKISKPIYVKLLHDLHDRGSAKNTILNIHSTASLIFKYAHEEKRIIKNNPTENVDLRFLDREKGKSVDETKILSDDEKFLEKEELAVFLNIAKERQKDYPQDYIIFLVLAYTGLRRGELSVLKWSDIDLENHTLSINKTFSYGETHRGNDVVLSPPKTIESNRIIDIDEFVVEQLKIHKAWQNEFKMKNRKNYNDLGFIFINTNLYKGYPIVPNLIYEHFKSILNEMDYEINLSPHSLRHTHASLCIEAGIPLRDIAERLGQSDTRTLEKIYAHTTKGQREKVSSKFNKLMEKVRLETPF